MKYTMEEVYAMCESRYALVNLVAERARELSDDALKRKEPLLEKPVNIVINNIRTGRSAIVAPNSAANIYKESDFEVSISTEE